MLGGGVWQHHVAEHLRSVVSAKSPEWAAELECSQYHIMTGVDIAAECLEKISKSVRTDLSERVLDLQPYVVNCLNTVIARFVLSIEHYVVEQP